MSLNPANPNRATIMEIKITKKNKIMLVKSSSAYTSFKVTCVS